MSEIIEYAWATGIRGTLDSDSMVRVAIFAPSAVARLLAFLFLRGLVTQRIAVGVNLLLPALWLAAYWPILVVGGPPVLVAALAGRCDGEDWSEGFIYDAAVGSWSSVWLAVAVALPVVKWKRARKVAFRPAA